MLKKLYVSLLMAVAIAAGAINVKARCVLPGASEVWEQADQIFVGRVVSVRQVGKESPQTRVTLALEQAFKGSKERRIVIQSVVTGSLAVKRGQSYLVAAYDAGLGRDRLRVSRCIPPRPKSAAPLLVEYMQYRAAGKSDAEALKLLKEPDPTDPLRW